MNYDDLPSYLKQEIDRLVKEKGYLSESILDKFIKNQNISNQEILNLLKKEILCKKNNELLKSNKDYFDNLFNGIDNSIFLDENQRKIILANEDSLLVMAGAGSGKTTTMAAKAKYLVDKCSYKQSEILVLAFTNKAGDEIRERIHNDFKLNQVEVTTFHKLGLNIIKKRLGGNIRIAGEKEQYQIISEYITKELFINKEEFRSFYNSFADKLNFPKNNLWEKFPDFISYHNAIFYKKYQASNKELVNYNNIQINNRKQYLKTIKGEYVLSKQEVDIANFLFKNNIYYEYEKTYAPQTERNYKPDFYIKQGENINYIEHFGIHEDNYNTRYTKEEIANYRYFKNKKIGYFKTQPKDLFITTYSKYNDGSNYLDKLKEEMLKRGYILKERKAEEIFNALRDTSLDTYYFKFIRFYAIYVINLFKNKTAADIKSVKNKLNSNELVVYDQMIKMVRYYQRELKRRNLIDFEDMILKANEILPSLKEEDFKVDYNYLIIDEYQDISMQRFNLTKKISDLFEAKVLAVGDDWQSIFGFAGAEIELILEFKEMMNNGKKTLIRNTYRNSKELLEVAKKFIEQNHRQFKKDLKSNKTIKYPVEVHVYDNYGKNSENNRINKIIKIIKEIYRNNPQDKILLLGRYNIDKGKLLNSQKFIKDNNDKLICTDCPNAKIEFLTIHRSKGLGYDQVIIVNMEDNKFGFPSKIEDERIISLLKNKLEEPIEFPEERRLFYVALTRTKNKTYILAPKTKQSLFVDEIFDDINVLVK